MSFPLRAVVFVPAVLMFLLFWGGCAPNTATLDGTWKMQPSQGGDTTWFEFNADRTGLFYATNSRPKDCVWTRLDDLDQLKAFVARTGVSLQRSVRDGTPLPYSPDGDYLILVDASAMKGFPLMKIISLNQKSLVVEFELEGGQTEVAMQRVERVEQGRQ